jgi:hypothetical protein
MEINRYDALLVLQLVGILLVYTEYDHLTNCSIPKLLGRLFVLFLPTILYINLRILNEAIIF